MTARITAALTCSACGREAGRLVKERCGACYMRLHRGVGGAARIVPELDPEIAELLLPVPRTSPTFAARLFAFVDFDGDCWEWGGAKNKGYGVIGRGSRGTGLAQAHLAMYQMLVGEIPPGMVWDHLCRNPSCVNPDHGEFVTNAENKRRGYGPGVLYAKREVCDNGGHPLDGVLGGRGGKARNRYCKTCPASESA